jgi:hypothetical protein
VDGKEFTVDYSMIVGNANYSIFENPVFLNHQIRLEIAGIMVFPAETNQIYCFYGPTK